MKKIVVKKIFEYDPTFNKKYSRFQGYSIITSQMASPTIKIPNSIQLPSGIDEPIFCSSLKRGQDTAEIFSKKLGVKVKKIPELNEVLFDLKKLTTEDEFNRFGSSIVRRKFIEAFIADELKETRIELKRRIKRLLDILGKLSEGSYLLISHSFFMKILKIYLKDPNLFNNPKILDKHFDLTKKTFEFGKGFEFNL